MYALYPHPSVTSSSWTAPNFLLGCQSMSNFCRLSTWSAIPTIFCSPKVLGKPVSSRALQYIVYLIKSHSWRKSTIPGLRIFAQQSHWNLWPCPMRGSWVLYTTSVFSLSSQKNRGSTHGINESHHFIARLRTPGLPCMAFAMGFAGRPGSNSVSYPLAPHAFHIDLGENKTWHLLGSIFKIFKSSHRHFLIFFGQAGSAPVLKRVTKTCASSFLGGSSAAHFANLEWTGREPGNLDCFWMFLTTSMTNSRAKRKKMKKTSKESKAM